MFELEPIKASITENSSTVFWSVVGFIILQNFGMICTGLWSFYLKFKKMRTDINKSWLAIRIISKKLNLDLGTLLEEQNNKKQERKE